MNTLIKTVTAACVALVLASFPRRFRAGGIPIQRRGMVEGQQRLRWRRAECVQRLFAWAVCTSRAGRLQKKMSRSNGTGHLQFS
jgi:hypothetical protein